MELTICFFRSKRSWRELLPKVLHTVLHLFIFTAACNPIFVNEHDR